MTVYLGVWHVFKQVQQVIWKSLAHWLFGPLFHTMFPNSKFPLKPRHKFLSWLLSLIRCLYPSIRPALQAALEEKAIPSHGLTYLRNLINLFEYVLPVVNKTC
jgi:hypothetical protein